MMNTTNMALDYFLEFYDAVENWHHACELPPKNAGYDKNAWYVPIHVRTHNGRYASEITPNHYST